MSGLSTDDRDDDVVRRLRADGALRIAREARWRTFAAWCAMATLAGGVSLAALNGWEARLQADGATAERKASARVEADGCRRLFEKLAGIEKEFHEKLRWARSEEERVRFRTAFAEARAVASRGGPTGCGGASASPAVRMKPRGCVLGGDDLLQGL